MFRSQPWNAKWAPVGTVTPVPLTETVTFAARRSIFSSTAAALASVFAVSIACGVLSLGFTGVTPVRAPLVKSPALAIIKFLAAVTLSIAASASNVLISVHVFPPTTEKSQPAEGLITAKIFFVAAGTVMASLTVVGRPPVPMVRPLAVAVPKHVFISSNNSTVTVLTVLSSSVPGFSSFVAALTCAGVLLANERDRNAFPVISSGGLGFSPFSLLQPAIRAVANAAKIRILVFIFIRLLMVYSLIFRALRFSRLLFNSVRFCSASSTPARAARRRYVSAPS